MTDGFALKSWVISLFNKASKKYNKYSLDKETRVGTWIDGKPIYRKFINISNISVPGTAGSTFTIKAIEDEDSFISAVLYELYFGHYICNPVACWNAGNNINVYIMANWDITSPRYIALEYTKTTDKATITV